MSSDDASNRQTLIPKDDPRQPDMFPAELIALERDRINSQDKRTEVARAAVDAQLESDKRQFDYHMARLNNEESDNRRKFTFASRYLWALFGVATVVFLFLVGVAFFGNPAQSALAMQILRTLGHIATGAGLLIFGRHAWRYLFDHSDES